MTDTLVATPDKRDCTCDCHHCRYGGHCRLPGNGCKVKSLADALRDSLKPKEAE